MSLFFLAALALSVSPPPPPPFFGCSTQGSCLRVLIEADESTEGSQECAQALEAVSEYATDYEAAGADADSGVSFFRARHNQHDPKFLYLTQPTSEYSPSLFSAWVLSKQHEKDLVIGDARSQPPALRLRVSDEPSLLKLPPLGEHKWSLPRRH